MRKLVLALSALLLLITPALAREPEEKYLYIPKAPLVRREREMKEFLEYKLDVCKKVLNGVQRGDGRYGDRDAWFKKQAAFYEEGLICLK